MTSTGHWEELQQCAEDTGMDEVHLKMRHLLFFFGWKTRLSSRDCLMVLFEVFVL